MSKITQIAGSTPIPPDTIRRLLNTRSEQDANDIINDFAKKNSNISVFYNKTLKSDT